ncbi:pentapeptide repeat-containing protein [Salmonella enterica subsp. enterica serovar Java]|nr:pentapeptide repeat-containing protein [Salmonella enterica subsp. enterica serovar Java]EMA6271228.1 pentapeptide repeat-containing protein [Salmonella enterica]
MKNVIMIFLIYTSITATITYLTNNYSHSFWGNFLINANSSILDFLVLGVILYYFEYQRQNKESINELLEDLGNLAKHSPIDLKIQKIKIIRQLNNKGVYKIDVPRIDLGDMITIKYLTFVNSELSGLDMSKSNIRDCSFTDCTIQALNINHSKISNVKFLRCRIKNIKATKSKIDGIVFEDCYLEGGDFSSSEMKSCVLKLCDLKNVKYENATMRNANIISARNVNIQRIIEAKDLDYLNCDEEVKFKLTEVKPTIKFSAIGNRG